jgi:hypothetical protein
LGHTFFKILKPNAHKTAHQKLKKKLFYERDSEYFPLPGQSDQVVKIGAVRRKIGLIEVNAKCRHLKKITCKGTLRQVLAV